MDEYIEANRALWNEWTRIHVRSEFYDVEGFKAGRRTLYPFEPTDVGDVAGKSLLHLQCHFGMDTLSWARLGAHVTGADLSPDAIDEARALAAALNIDAKFVCANLYDLPDALEGTFDVVYTGRGAIYWLPDLPRWARVVAHFLNPGGVFYIHEFHPVAYLFDDRPGVTELRIGYPYFHSDEPLN